MNTQPNLAAHSLHGCNLEIARESVRVELLEAIEYERNHAPIGWFKTYENPRRHYGNAVKAERNGKIERRKLMNRKDNLRACMEIEAEILLLNKILAEEKQ